MAIAANAWCGGNQLNPRQNIKTGWAWPTLFLLWSAAFALACRLAGPAADNDPLGDSLALKLFGETRVAVSGVLLDEADRAFHKGLGHYTKQAFTNWFVRAYSSISAAGAVEHLHAEGVRDIIPWIWMSVQANPSNITAYGVAAFFLANEYQRPDLAEQVLREAQHNNPRDYRVYLDQGRLFLKEGRLRDASRVLDAGLRLWPSGLDESDLDMKLDRAEMLTYRGLLYEMDGAVEEAQHSYQLVLDPFPDRAGVKERLAELREFGRAKVSPEDLARQILLSRRYVCDQKELGDRKATDGHDH